ncbi:ABC transporter permease [Bacillus sp. JJ722]|uniref:ABC transporter permease n=1 Tax=Bacillus sp. JJ722 TaxID=3122973 RepID=UPI003000A338
MNAYIRLLKTDFRSFRYWILLTFILFGATEFILIYLLSRYSKDQLSIWFYGLNGSAFVAAILVPVILSFAIWIYEWRQNTHYSLLLLPISRSMIFFSKLSVVLFVDTILLLTTLLFWSREWLLQGGWLNVDAGIVSSLFITLVTIHLLAFFSVLTGLCAKKFQVLVTTAVFIVLFPVPTLLAYVLIALNGQAEIGFVFSGVIVIKNDEPLLLVPMLVNVLFCVLYSFGGIALFRSKIHT